MPKSQFASFIKARKNLSKGCIYHLVRVGDMDFESLLLSRSLLLMSFQKCFPIIYRVFHQKEIDFYIDLLPDTQPISIPSYQV